MDAARSRRRALGALAIAAACVGALILAALVAYYGVRLYGASTLDDMEASIAAPAAMPPPPSGETVVHGAIMPDGAFKPIATVVEREGGALPLRSAPIATVAAAETSPPPSAAKPSPTADAGRDAVPAVPVVPDVPAAPETAVAAPSPDAGGIAAAVAETSAESESTPPVEASPAPDGGALVAAYNSIYPALSMHPKYWRSPATAGSDPYTFGAAMRPDGFISLSAERGEPPGSAPDAAHVVIPSIGVDSEVANLAILDLGDRREYETPNKVVGRIPEKANPGEIGGTWLFGHLESPIMGEGDVFRRLPEIPDLLRMGDPVYVNVRNEADDEFLYQITETKVVHQDELAPYVYGEQPKKAVITLVACVPRLVYDHRILVIGELVGVKRAA